jgi:hypothetical protein
MAYEFVLVTFVVQFLISVLMYFSGRGQHEVDAAGADVFRIFPGAAWFITIGMYSIAAFTAYTIAVATPSPLSAPPVAFVAEVATFLGGLYGIYAITMRIRVDSESVRVSSFLGARVIRFRDIRSVTDEETGRYRTLDVMDARGKRVLRATSSLLPDYSDLVYSLQHGAKKPHPFDESVKSHDNVTPN